MATLKQSSKSAKSTHKLKPAGDRTPVSMTLRLDRKTYRRMVLLGTMGERLRTNQEIMLAALTEYLDKHKVQMKLDE